MDSIKLKEEQLKLEKKLAKDGVNGDLVADLRTLADMNDREGLEYKMKELAKHRQAVISTKKSDEKLQEIAAQKRELEAPYREQLSQNDLKARFIGLLLQELNHFGDK